MSENRFGEAVSLLMDAATLLNNQGDIAKRINEFIGTVHPAECVTWPEAEPLESYVRNCQIEARQDGGGYLFYRKENGEWIARLDGYSIRPIKPQSFPQISEHSAARSDEAKEK